MVSWQIVALALAVVAIIYHFATAKPAAALIVQPVGTSVWCSKSDPQQQPNSAVYRVMSGDAIAYYPSPDIASTWNPTWNAQIKAIDCTGVKFQGNLQIKK